MEKDNICEMLSVMADMPTIPLLAELSHFRRFSAILRGICEILLFHSIHLSHKNLVFSYINL